MGPCEYAGLDWDELLLPLMLAKLGLASMRDAWGGGMEGGIEKCGGICDDGS
jgi:hypothetical protein